MKDIIVNRLKDIEKIEKIRVLLAVESGSRTWGFASKDSDYDVRFIYVRNEEAYLRLDPFRDVLEYPISDELDIHGWDLKKALQLLYKSNPTVIEWLSSEIIYVDSELAVSLRKIMECYVSEKKELYHYLSMAENNYKTYLCKETVQIKKYFYALRPVLACKWMLNKKTVPPIEFSTLVQEELPEYLKEKVQYLLDIKMHSNEIKEVKQISEVNAYLEHSITDIKTIVKNLPAEEKNSIDELNELFIRAIRNEVKDGERYNSEWRIEECGI